MSAPPLAPPLPPPSHPPVAWSESRARRYRECKRRYYLRIYRQHGGWNRGASSEARLAWALGRLTTLSREIGTAIHDAALICVRACVRGRPTPSAKEIRALCASRLNAVVRGSRRGVDAFLRDPAAAPQMLEELFYGGAGLTPAEVARSRERLDVVAANLAGATAVWDELRGAAPDDVRLVSPFYAFRIEPEQALVYAAPDLIYRPRGDAPWTILDWKTGTRDGAIDQLCTYGVALAEGLGLAPADGEYRGRIVALGDGGDHCVAISESDLGYARQRISDDLRRMRADADLLAADDDDTRAREIFPATTAPRTCERCAYRGICYTERLPRAAAAWVHADDGEAVAGPSRPGVPS